MYTINYCEASSVYTMVETARLLFTPYRFALKAAMRAEQNQFSYISNLSSNRMLTAYLELAERITRQYPKPEFGIKHTHINDKKVKITEEVVLEKPFCKLLHFKKHSEINQPKLLIIAPLSGHYSTLLKGTVEDTLPFFDVYITDWENARDVPMSEGAFNLSDFVEYCREFMSIFHERIHVMPVCQPCVPALAALALMSEENCPYTPKSMILIGGPIDAKESPTKINKFATTKKMNWFENNVITRVPINYPGFMRPVYPGFYQLSGFMAMNMQKHVGEHIKLFNHLVQGDGDSSEKHRQFYDEYLSVMDLPAEYYLQTIQTVFKDHALPEGKMMVGCRKVKLEEIRNTALLVIEGEKDDITGLGQTKAALNLCSNVPSSKKKYHLQSGVGHYGSFNGTKFRNEIVPVIKEFCYKQS